MLVTSIFKSVFRRRDVNIFLSFVFLPIMVPFLSGKMQGLESDYTRSFISFLETVLPTQFHIVLPLLIFSFIISSVFRDEIDSGILFLYRDVNRKKIFNAKIASLFTIYLIYFLGTLVTSAIAYFGVMVPQWGVSPSFFPEDASLIYPAILKVLVYALLHLLVILLVSMLSIRYKTVTAVLSGVLFTLFTSVAPLLIGIKYLFPNGYIESLEQLGALPTTLVILTLSVIYFLFFYLKGKSDFQKVEF